MPVRAILIFVTMWMLSACASLLEAPDTTDIEDLSAEEIYNEAETSLNDERFEQAAKKFGEIERLYPYSELAKLGLIMQAYAYYQDRDYDNSRSSALRYLDFFPASEDAAYAQYLVGLSYYDQIDDVGRDQSLALNSIQQFQIVIERYPESEYVSEAEERFALAFDHLAAKEMEVGRDYLKRGYYGAAVKRFNVVVDDFSSTSQTPEALHRLTEAYFSLGLEDEARASAQILRENYPDSEWNTYSQSLLAAYEQGRLLPQDGNWFSRLYRQTVKGEWL